jgi:glycine/D-amino acid oxidase-like deaminating enzyme/nitrite reductase/ring-hydroxylating ferredoxin subunit
MGRLLQANPSIWSQGGTGSTYPKLGEDRQFDVVVIGGGIAGLTTALLLKRQGATVAVLESDRVCSGVTGYTTAKVSVLHGAMYSRLEEKHGPHVAATYARANVAGLELVASLVDELGIACDFERHTAYTYTEGEDSLETIHAEVEAAQLAGLPARFTTDTDLPFPVAGAVELGDQALFHPRKYCLALAAAIVGEGSQVFESTRATDVSDGEAVEVTTQAGHKVMAGNVVVATHLPFLDRGLYFVRTAPYRSYATAVRLRGRAPRGMYLSIDQPSRSLRPIAGFGENLLLVGGEGHKTGQDIDTRLRYEALEAWSADRFKGSVTTHRWSAQDYMPADDLPYIGRLWAGSHRLWTATGFQKWGMTNGTAAALILVDLLNGKENPWAATFDSLRVDLDGSAEKVVAENADVARQFVGERLATLSPPDAETLAMGEGGLVSLGGRKVAAYRDREGELHAVTAACSHLGCLVSFNTAEVTWDCPCHGSRFDVDGQVIAGPAVRDLTKVDADLSAT